MMTQAQKAIAFRALHARGHAFIIPNPWDVGTASLLKQLGFEARPLPARVTPFLQVSAITPSVATKCWPMSRRSRPRPICR